MCVVSIVALEALLGFLKLESFFFRTSYTFRFEEDALRVGEDLGEALRRGELMAYLLQSTVLLLDTL